MSNLPTAMTPQELMLNWSLPQDLELQQQLAQAVRAVLTQLPNLNNTKLAQASSQPSSEFSHEFFTQLLAQPTHAFICERSFDKSTRTHEILVRFSPDAIVAHATQRQSLFIYAQCQETKSDRENVVFIPLHVGTTLRTLPSPATFEREFNVTWHHLQSSATSSNKQGQLRFSNQLLKELEKHRGQYSEIQEWQEYLEFEKDFIAYYKSNGLRYLDYAYNKERHELQLLLVAPSSKYFDYTFKMIAEHDILLFQGSASQDALMFTVDGQNLHNIQKIFNGLQSITQDSLLNPEKVANSSDAQIEPRLLKVYRACRHLPVVQHQEQEFIAACRKLVQQAQGSTFTPNTQQAKNKLYFKICRVKLEANIQPQDLKKVPKCGFLAYAILGDAALNKRQAENIKKLHTKQALQAPYLRFYLFNIDNVEAHEPATGTISWFNQNLNANQQLAVRKMLTPQELTLVQGPPGTGKTTVIAEAISQLARHGQRVILSSQSHDALDNALARNRTDPHVRALRIARNPERITAQGQAYHEKNSLTTFYQTLAQKFAQDGTAIEQQQNLQLATKIAIETVNFINFLYTQLENCKSWSLPPADLLKQTQDYLRGYSDTLPKKILDFKELFVPALFASLLTKNFDLLDKVKTFKKLKALLEHIRICTMQGDVLQQYIVKTIQKNKSTTQIESEEIFEVEELFQKTPEFFQKTTLLSMRSEFIEMFKNNNSSIIPSHLLMPLTDYFERKAIAYLGDNFGNTEANCAYFQELIDLTFIRSRERMQDLPPTHITHKMEELFRFPTLDMLRQIEQEIKQAQDKETTAPTPYNEPTRNALHEIAKSIYQDFKASEQADNDWEDLQEDYLNTINLIAVSCNEDPRTYQNFKIDNFDVAIIDEVSKATPVELLQPMLRAQRTILIGDHKQLPPVYTDQYFDVQQHTRVRQEEYRDDTKQVKKKLKTFEQFYTTSLFNSMFLKAHESVRQSLNIQYRCHPSIMQTFNPFYAAQLECGSPNKEYKHGIVIRSEQDTIIDAQTHVVWVDTSNPQVDSQLSNKLEAQMIAQALLKLDQALAAQTPAANHGASSKTEVGIVCFYQPQCSVIREQIRKQLQQHGIKELRHLTYDVNTVNRYQGKEKSIIILSVTRDRPTQYEDTHSQAFISKPNFINVAMSRAQNLLMIFGSQRMLEHKLVNLEGKDIPYYQQLLAMFEQPHQTNFRKYSRRDFQKYFTLDQ